MLRFPLLLLFLASAALAEEEPLRKIAFVSCFKEQQPSRALESIADWKPDLFLWMGDNIYGDTPDPKVLRGKWKTAAENVPYRKIVKNAVVLGTWDDHDYGKNDAGKEFPMKKEAQKEFLDFLKVSADDSRREREGIYHYEDFGPEGQQVRVILLDTRYHRDAIGSEGSILGDEQWLWLEKALRESPAEVNLLVSSIQVLAKEHRFEKWANFPQERARLLALLAEPSVSPVLILSGDRHLAEISRVKLANGEELYDITSSSLNSSFGGNPKEVNSLRLGENYGQNNYGTIQLEWKDDGADIKVAVRDELAKEQLGLVLSVGR